VAAVIAGTIPCTIVVVWLTYGYQAVKDNPLALGAIGGMLASAAGLMFAAAWNLVRPHVRRKTWLRALVLAGSAAVLTGVLHITPIEVIAAAALVGFFWQAGEEA
jgi:chromate transport protein ChrA